jgi:hypothetical protein
MKEEVVSKSTGAGADYVTLRVTQHYIPRSIFHLARFLYVRPETFGPYHYVQENLIQCYGSIKKKNQPMFKLASCGFWSATARLLSNNLLFVTWKPSWLTAFKFRKLSM